MFEFLRANTPGGGPVESGAEGTDAPERVVQPEDRSHALAKIALTGAIVTLAVRGEEVSLGDTFDVPISKEIAEANPSDLRTIMALEERRPSDPLLQDIDAARQVAKFQCVQPIAHYNGVVEIDVTSSIVKPPSPPDTAEPS